MNVNKIIEVVSATRLSEEQFWSTTALGQSLKRLQGNTHIKPCIFFQNRRGLSEIYNDRIASVELAEILVFIHDDVWIDDFFFAERIVDGLTAFDVLGVVGNRRLTEQQTSWAFMDDQFTTDVRENFSGAIAHGKQPFGTVEFLGSSPESCAILDGLFLAVKKQMLLRRGVSFDPQFDFHFYDLDFCRTASLRGLRLGTWPIALTHQSGGAFNSPQWIEKKLLYRKKWSATIARDETLASTTDLISNTGPIHLYHNAYSQTTLEAKESGYLLLDNLANERPDWYEYWPIRRFLLNTPLDENAVYGFFSPRFREKSGLSCDEVMAFIRAADPNTDVFTFSPQPDIGAFFRNVFEGGDYFSPGFLATSQQFLDEIGYVVDLKTLVMDSRSIVFSNYFVARPRFWREWLKITEKLFGIAEAAGQSELKQQLVAPTTYPGSVQRKVFVMEGVVSLLLSTNAWHVAVCNPFRMSWSQIFSQHRQNAILSDALKTSMNTLGFPEYSSAFEQLKRGILSKVGPQTPKGSAMEQTPAHDLFNETILAMLPIRLSKVVEVGCMRGSLAREYLKDNPHCRWTGIDIDAENARIARGVCSQVHCMDIEDMSDVDMDALSPVDAWVFGDTLEHLRDPWRMLRRIRERLPTSGAVIACIPNAQHWSFQSRLNVGLFRYEDEGLFDRTHLRFFTRTTIFEMFQAMGFRIESAVSRTISAPGAEKYLPHIRAMASASGFSPDQAEADAMPFQYVVKAVPI
jgi:2-polyprenyl-3-methyl-5-hydroxy-6-metoxy-1,4-benzoquinol methylase